MAAMLGQNQAPRRCRSAVCTGDGESDCPFCRQLTPSGNPTLLAATRSVVAPQKVEAKRAMRSAMRDANKVRLHIYDVREGTIQHLNAIFAHTDVPVKFGGIFHVGVQVYGEEWAFGYNGGIFRHAPRGNAQHHFRETVELGETKMSRWAFAGLVADMRNEYPGRSYNLLSNNCCNFAEDLCHRLGAASVPNWVNRWARIAAHMNGVIDFSSLRSQNTDSGHKSLSSSVQL